MSDKSEIGYALRLSSELYEQVKTAAAENNRSINAQIVQWIESGLAPNEREDRIAALESRIAVLEAQARQ